MPRPTAPAPPAPPAPQEPEPLTFESDGKRFTHVGTAESSVEELDAWLRAHNLPKLSTTMCVNQTLERPLFLVWRSDSRHAMAVSVSGDGSGHREQIQLNWLKDCRVRRTSDGELAVSYTPAPVTDVERAGGVEVDVRERAENRIAFGLRAVGEAEEVTAVRMPLLTPRGLDSGLTQWRAGVEADGIPYWLQYMYVVMESADSSSSSSCVRGFMLLETQDGDFFVAEGEVDLPFAARLAARMRPARSERT